MKLRDPWCSWVFFPRLNTKFKVVGGRGTDLPVVPRQCFEVLHKLQHILVGAVPAWLVLSSHSGRPRC